MFIHKERHGEEEEAVDPAKIEEVELIVAKHRNGPLGNIKIGWKAETSSFINISQGKA
jgi:replicative DNA helicase